MTDPSPRAEEAFLDALDRPQAERRTFLADLLADEPGILREALALLADHDGLGSFLETPAGTLLEDDLALADPSVGSGTRVGRYVVERLLGTGGAGHVYVARQERPSRSVALKFLRGGLTSPDAVRRFLAEAELLARLTHPGVAHVYEAGVHEVEGQRVPFLALELVEDARDVVAFADEQGLGLRARLELAAAICDAVHHGHQKGVLHLDLKPANVLVDGAGRPKIIDFGIGQERDRGDGLHDERRGVVGTLASMSPEQAAGAPDGLDVRADVYALGVLTFELLTGELPIDVRDDDVTTALERVLDESPRRAGELDRRLRGEIDAILAHALAKDRDDRYASAASLAADLRRFLRREPVSVVPLTLGYQLRTFARRRRVAAASLAGLVLVSVAFAIGATLLAARAERRRAEAELSAYVADVGAAAAALAVHDVGTARARLEAAPAALRQWEWRHLASRLDDSDARFRVEAARVGLAASSPDGTRIAVSGVREPNLNFVAVYGLPRGALAFERPMPMKVPATVLAWDGDRLLVGRHDGAVVRLDPSGDVEASYRVHDEQANDLLVLPSRDRFLAALRDGTVRAYALDDGAELAVWRGHADRVIDLALSPDGMQVASAGRDGQVRVWDVARGDCVRTLVGHDGSVEAVTWTCDGRTLVSAGRDGTVRMWDAASGRALATRREHAGVVRDVASVPDSPLVASASWDRTIRLWDPRTGAPRGVLGGPRTRLNALVRGPEPDGLWALAESGVVRRFRIAVRSDPVRLSGHTDWVRWVAFSPDGGRLASVSNDGRVLVHDVSTGASIGEFAAGARGHAVAFADERELVVIAHVERGVTVPLDGPGLRVHVARLSAIGVARAAHGGALWAGTSSGRLLRVAPGPTVERRLPDLSEEPIDALAMVPGTGTFVAVVRGGRIGVWSGDARPREWHALPLDAASCLDVAPDGTLAAVADRSGAVWLVSLETFESTTLLAEAGSPVFDVTFSPDGRRLATAGRDGLVRVWDPASRREVARLGGTNETVRCLAWSPDGTVLAAGGGEWEAPGTITLWRAPPDVEFE